MRDLGLSYIEAAHGIQSAKTLDLINGEKIFEPNHMRLGIDLSKSDMRGLVELLLDKGIFTQDEYLEYMRLAANEELAMEQDRHGGLQFR